MWSTRQHPLLGFVWSLLISSPLPSSITYAWNFGSLLGVMLMVQIVTGVLLAAHYTDHVAWAFDSVEAIMSELPSGWALRYTHANGASFFLFLLFLHVGNALYYSSYLAPSTLLWTIGVIILILTMGTAFLGYTLIWGQMSFWGATVITNFISAIPVFGVPIVEWVWGGFAVDQPTLNRFFMLHFLLPFIILGAVVCHLISLHYAGSTQPIGSGLSTDKVRFHPYFTLKDVVGVLILQLAMVILVGWLPNSLGHPDNYIAANPLGTPAHIVPEWYFLPFYAILRVLPNKQLGVLALLGSLLILLVLPLSESSPFVSRSSAYFPISSFLFWAFAANFFLLGWLGTQPVEPTSVWVGQWATLFYFGYFIWACIE